MPVVVPFVGELHPELPVGGKFPTKAECLSVFFYNIRVKKLDSRQSANLVAAECIEIYNKAKIPATATPTVTHQLLKMYLDWKKVQKRVKSARYEEKGKKFQNDMEIVFDIKKNKTDKPSNIAKKPKGNSTSDKPKKKVNLK